MYSYLVVIVLSGISFVSYASDRSQSDVEQAAQNSVKKTIATALQAHVDFQETLLSHFTQAELAFLHGGEQFVAAHLISEKKKAAAFINQADQHLQGFKASIEALRKKEADLLEARRKAQREERQKQMRTALPETSGPTVEFAAPAPVADVPSANKK